MEWDGDGNDNISKWVPPRSMFYKELLFNKFCPLKQVTHFWAVPSFRVKMHLGKDVVFVETILFAFHWSLILFTLCFECKNLNEPWSFVRVNLFSFSKDNLVRKCHHNINWPMTNALFRSWHALIPHPFSNTWEISSKFSCISCDFELHPSSISRYGWTQDKISNWEDTTFNLFQWNKRKHSFAYGPAKNHSVGCRKCRGWCQSIKLVFRSWWDILLREF